MCFSNLSWDKTRTKIECSGFCLGHTGWKFQELNALPHPLFRLTWESPSPSMFWLCVVRVFSCQRSFQPRRVRASRRLPAATCFVCYLQVRFRSYLFYPSGTHKVAVEQSVTHFCNAADVRKPQASIHSLNVCHETVMPPKPRLQQVTR